MSEIEIVRKILTWHREATERFLSEGHRPIEADGMAIGYTSVELAKLLAEREAPTKEQLIAACERCETCGFHAIDRRTEAVRKLFTEREAPPDLASLERLAKAVDLFICHTCSNRIGWTGEFDMEQSRQGRQDWRSCETCCDIRAALAQLKVQR